MSTTKAQQFWRGRRLRAALYTVGVLLAITIAGVVRTSPTHDTAAHAKAPVTASLTAVDSLTIAPIADQTSSAGVPVEPVTPSASFTQPAPGAVLVWTALGLPPGIAISSTSGVLAGTPTVTGAYPVTVVATADTHPPTAASQSLNWVVRDTAPHVTQVAPTNGAGGTRVVLSGRSLLGATSVHFGSVPATTFTVDKRGTTIVARAPAQKAGVVVVTVTSAGGTSLPVAVDRFTYVAPSITGVSMHAGPATGGTRVRITGVGLAGATEVRFGNVLSRDFAVHRTGELLTAVAPAGAAGTVLIEVVTPGGVASTRGHTGFTYRAHVPGEHTPQRTS